MNTKERPILFSAPMVRAILEDRKTQTRRIVKPQPPSECGIHYMLGNESWLPVEGRSPFRHLWEAWHGPLFENRPNGHLSGAHSVVCPYGAPGDRLWVRETFAPHDIGAMEWRDKKLIYYRADDETKYDCDGVWKPSIHMPRWASRITLEIVSVRVERLQEIDRDDCAHEGLQSTEFMPELKWPPTDGYLHRDDHERVRMGFKALWNSINGPESWDANPFVWVVEFKRIPQP